MYPSSILSTVQANKMTLSLPLLKVLISGAGIASPCLAYWDLSHASQHQHHQSPSSSALQCRAQLVKPSTSVAQRSVNVRHTNEEGTGFINGAGKSFAEFGKGASMTAEFGNYRMSLHTRRYVMPGLLNVSASYVGAYLRRNLPHIHLVLL
jgi:hypothetical protein